MLKLAIKQKISDRDDSLGFMTKVKNLIKCIKKKLATVLEKITVIVKNF